MLVPDSLACRVIELNLVLQTFIHTVTNCWKLELEISLALKHQYVASLSTPKVT